ncbi:translation initiation factor IF-2, putative [Trypanosoma brucei gambiense DAL972]|uniref:Translation initiation factor IF-2, chloroplastic n=1 Tax=Trypanosoma brucei gambiense (strain MHOM/CI/86/DAL972) TaxID=679716 RepID=C9ZSN7_TRYB9|nr:translation initiation factor IF-2, putative [Trypanosoma brucei gambiense DAL972]7PUA_IA Chain IA, Translation initiation factor IF-2, putative [Trypanosoma brucei brucei]7PUB_IA Chain IA, Translation initiation factor IF-2, putative [Trypanosoma brucei brucei]CBH12421.1 translation initiation factor IF-2, putative [Trypanosoma brucei gambiense DAL972]|eukprot:XP_011774702.1 translation initiation factor IF-2, putative [Trypanosoma brucei gambiense DAL972]
MQSGLCHCVRRVAALGSVANLHHFTNLPSGFSVWTSRRWQSQSSRGQPGLQWQEGVVDPRYSSSGNMRRFNPDTVAHYVKATIQNDRREMGLGEVYDWHEFAKDAVYIPTRSGPLWVGSDDPRCAKFMRRRSKMQKTPQQKARPKPGPDPAKALEDHPLREYFTTATNLRDPLSTANNLHRAGLIREYDIKYTAAKVRYVPRPPVVSIMGHVDHGKTTLLDYLRKTNVASQEAGGITQNVGAFQVKTLGDTLVTFIDTPGHAAFTTMREVGATANDLIVLVVSAVDGVQPQTKEVIELAHKSGIPFVVACTKIDRQPRVENVKQQLRDCNVELEEDGGDTQFVPVCARDGRGVPELLEAIALQAELCEISTPKPSRCEVTVIETNGVNTTTEVAGIVRCGKVRAGQVLVAGMTYAVVRKVLDEHGQIIQEAGPSQPVVLHGFRVHPKPGSILLQVSSESHAQKFYHFMKEVYQAEGRREDYLQLLNQEQHGMLYARKPDNNLVRTYSTQAFVLSCKAATFGMLQALMKSIYEIPRLEGISTEIKVTEVGGLRDYDVALIGSSGQPGCILLYGGCKDTNTLDVPNHVTVIRFNVLYHGLEALKETLVGALPKITKIRVTAEAECLQVFRASQAGKSGNAGGMRVTKGTIIAAHLTFRVCRKAPLVKGTAETDGVSDNEGDGDEDMLGHRVVVYEGQIKELRRFKELVPSVELGLECGVIMQDEFQFRTGDILQQYETYEEPRDVAEEYQKAELREKIMRDTAAAEALLAESTGGEDKPTEESEVKTTI